MKARQVTTPVKSRQVSTLADLGVIREALRERERQVAHAREVERQHRQNAERQRHYFRNAVGPVTPLPLHHRADLRPVPPAPIPRQRELDEQAALLEAMSDEVDVESLLLTDDGLSFRRPGVGIDVVTRLRKGRWTVQAEIDLHGLRRDEAREALGAFLRTTLRKGQRCVRVIHGKGLGSPGRTPVLKGKVHRWLAQTGEVIAFAQAAGPQGGAGALVVLLAGSNSR